MSHERRRRKVLPVLFALLALLALLAGVTFGTGWFQGQHIGQAAKTQPKLVATHTAHTVTAIPTTKSTAVPTTVPPTATTGTMPPPTQAPPVYPVLGKTYGGKITNTRVTPNVTAPIVLSNIAQNNANISGYLDIQSTELQGSGNFTGTVATNKTIQFVVASFAGHDPLAFTGTIQPDGSISNGTYCGVMNGSCDDAQGHGTWYTNSPSAINPFTPQNNIHVALSARTTYNKNDEN